MSLSVNYVAPADQTGYSCAAAQYIRLLVRAGIPVHFLPLQPGPGLGIWYEPATLPGQVEALPEPLRSAARAPLLPDAPTILHVVPEYYAPLAALLRQRGLRGPILGMTVWETSRLPRHWPALLNRLAGVIVPSVWNAEVFRRSGVVVPLHTVPHAAEFTDALPDPESMASLRRRLPELRGRFVFYSIAAWNLRKGNDLLLRAWTEAFAGRDDVALVLKTSPRSLDPPLPRWRRVLTRSGDPVAAARRLQPAGVFLLTDELPVEEVAALHALGDCYVTCSRGEGWGMGLYEAALLGKPVVAPEEGGHRAYLSDAHATGLFRSRWVPVRTRAFDASYTSDQLWVEPSITAAAQAMREVVASRQQAREQAALRGAQLRKAFSPANILAPLLAILREPHGASELQGNP